MAETAVPLDAAGRATEPAIAWFDKRTRAEVAEIERRIGADRLFAISGLAPNPIFGLCKLLWHRRHRVDAFARTVRWLNVADYLAWRLCGEMATDYSLASRTFALDVSALAWSAEVLEAMQVEPSLMAPLMASGRRLGTVSAEAAAATGLPRHCVVAVGHDHVVGRSPPMPCVPASCSAPPAPPKRSSWAWPRPGATRRWAAPAFRRA